MADRDSLRFQYAQQLWGLSSGIAAFCVLQTLGLAYNFQHSEFRAQIAQSRSAILWVIAVASVIYLGAVGWVERSQFKIISPLDPELRGTAMGVAVLKLAVIVLSCGAAMALCGTARP